MREQSAETDRPVEQEFLSVIREYERVIYKVCYLYANPNAPLNDLYQDVVLNLWKAYPKFRKECKISTWIYRIALNTCISFYRKEKNIPEIVSLTKEIDWSIEAHDPVNEMLKQLYRMINQLGQLDKSRREELRGDCGDYRTDGNECGYQVKPHQRQTKKNEKGRLKIYGTGRIEEILECTR